MSFIDCLKQKLKDKKISSQKVNDVERKYNELLNKYKKTLGDDGS